MASMTDPGAHRAGERWRRLTAALATAGLALALVAGLALLVAGPGHRSGWWSFGTAFGIMRWAAYGGIAAAAVSAAALILAPLRAHRRGMLRALAGLVIGLITVGVPAYLLQKARSVPPIHDITTDTEDPPAFETILPLRAQAPNPATYGGPAVAAQQREGYPDIAPADYPVDTEAAFEAAVAAARELGWTVVAMDEAGADRGDRSHLLVRLRRRRRDPDPPDRCRQPDRRPLGLAGRGERRGHQRRAHPRLPRAARREVRRDRLISGSPAVLPAGGFESGIAALPCGAGDLEVVRARRDSRRWRVGDVCLAGGRMRLAASGAWITACAVDRAVGLGRAEGADQKQCLHRGVDASHAGRLSRLPLPLG